MISYRGGERTAAALPVSGTSNTALFQMAVLDTEVAERDTPVPSPTATQEEPTPETMPTGIGGYFTPETPEAQLDVAAPLTRTEIITYEVQQGDIVGTIAQKFGISENTVCWANGGLADNPDYLRVGQTLFILPVTGVMHVVEKGDNLSKIAELYKASVEDIIAFPGNSLTESDVIVEGQALIVPNGKKPYVPRVVYAYSGTVPKGARQGTGAFVWPTTGVITQKFWAQHLALDIGWNEGTPVRAADSGFVASVGNSVGHYGRYVIIDHGNGYRTLYAHLKVYYVQQGQSVGKGEQIGLMGNTGNSTGPHLHFEVEKNGIKVNPLTYLP